MASSPTAPKAGRPNRAGDRTRRSLEPGRRQPLHRHQPGGPAPMLYEKIYCARGQAENLIKAHKLHLASDRTSCTKATANQFRLLIHTAAYWLLHTLRGLAPKVVLARRPVRHNPSRSSRSPSASPNWSPGSRSRCQPASPIRTVGCCSPSAPSDAHPDRRGSVPRPSPSPATLTPQIPSQIAPTAPPPRMPNCRQPPPATSTP